MQESWKLVQGVPEDSVIIRVTNITVATQKKVLWLNQK